MKIDTRQTFTEYDGKPINKTEVNEKTQKPEQVLITLREILGNIIMVQLPDDKPTAESLSQRDQLCRKLYASKEPDFSLHERTLIMERLPKVYPAPRIFGLVSEILDPKEVVEEEKVTNHKMAAKA